MLFEFVRRLGDEELTRLSEMMAEAVHLSTLVDAELSTPHCVSYLATCNFERLVRKFGVPIAISPSNNSSLVPDPSSVAALGRAEYRQ